MSNSRTVSGFFRDGLMWIKNIFTPRVDEYVNASDDMRVLALLAASMQFMQRQQDTRAYWYYFIRSKKNVDIAKFILARNGFNAENYNSPHHFPGLRVPADDIKQDKAKTDFIDNMEIAIMNRRDSVWYTSRYLDKVYKEYYTRQH